MRESFSLFAFRISLFAFRFLPLFLSFCMSSTHQIDRQHQVNWFEFSHKIEFTLFHRSRIASSERETYSVTSGGMWWKILLLMKKEGESAILPLDTNIQVNLPSGKKERKQYRCVCSKLTYYFHYFATYILMVDLEFARWTRSFSHFICLSSSSFAASSFLHIEAIDYLRILCRVCDDCTARLHRSTRGSHSSTRL